MGERKGTNKYYPPDFDPAKHRSLNGYHGVHALRERGKKADKGIIIIRFEMPYNAWCLTCKQPIGMGVRYNAEKKKVGMFHSTPIYQFSMKCAMCAGDIVMQTDPENFDYICVEGIRRKVQTWDPEENEQIVVPDFKERQKLSMDAMYQVEYGVKDKEKAALAHPNIEQIGADREVYVDDFRLNQLARKQLREAKVLQKAATERDDALKSRLSLSGSQVSILPESEEDAKKAKLMRLLRTSKKEEKLRSDLEPILDVGPSTSKRKISESEAFTMTKKRVTSHFLEKRANAFGKSEGVTDSVLSRRELSSLGVVRKPPKDSTAGEGSSLVAYEDSD